ncbi:UNVERIFIED_CONTAM: hypothetical protein FKN15_054758 [Acipenser sinensis]
MASNLSDSLTSMDWLPQLNLKGCVKSRSSELGAQTEKGPRGTSKPPFSYATLISQAIKSTPRGRMSLNDIYSWICEQYPFYKNTGAGWKNSIRHNLSLNKCFRKIPRPRDDPGKAFDRGEVETAEEWIHLKAILLPKVDQEKCFTCLKGEEWCFAIGKVGHKATDQPPPWQEVEPLIPKRGRRGGAKKAKKQAPVPGRGEPVHPVPRRGEPMHPVPGRGEPVHPAPMKVEPEHQEPKRGKLKSGCWDDYLHLVEASSWCPSWGKGGPLRHQLPPPWRGGGGTTEGQLGSIPQRS